MLVVEVGGRCREAASFIRSLARARALEALAQLRSAPVLSAHPVLCPVGAVFGERPGLGVQGRMGSVSSALSYPCHLFRVLLLRRLRLPLPLLLSAPAGAVTFCDHRAACARSGVLHAFAEKMGQESPPTHALETS